MKYANVQTLSKHRNKQKGQIFKLPAGKDTTAMDQDSVLTYTPVSQEPALNPASHSWCGCYITGLVYLPALPFSSWSE